MIPIVLGVAILVFTLMYFCPGDPASIINGSAATEEENQRTRESLGLDQPFVIQLGTYLSDTFIHFDLGSSWLSQADIWTSIKDRLPRTFFLTLAMIGLAVVIGIPLGIVAAVNQGGIGDNICMVLALVGVSIPNFWLAMLLILLFSVNLGWLPSMGSGGIEYYILPALAGCTGSLATLARQTRSSMLEVIRSDYITTARAKGVSEFMVIVRHALKNALIPIITVIGTQFGVTMGGTLVLEVIFTIPGMGTLITTAVNNRDYPVIRAGAVFLAIIFSFCMLVVDLVYAAVDPRIKAQYSGKKRKVKKDA